MFIPWKSIEERLRCFFSVVFREELLLKCLFLLGKEKSSSFVFGLGISRGSMPAAPRVCPSAGSIQACCNLAGHTVHCQRDCLNLT
ncbi:hypothetical protein F2P79_020718 [Pimephales promelas]|nr:hypothetical protein F2P79_020718 [Pimephales promelas]